MYIPSQQSPKLCMYTTKTKVTKWCMKPSNTNSASPIANFDTKPRLSSSSKTKQQTAHLIQSRTFSSFHFPKALPSKRWTNLRCPLQTLSPRSHQSHHDILILLSTQVPSSLLAFTSILDISIHRSSLLHQLTLLQEVRCLSSWCKVVPIETFFRVHGRSWSGRDWGEEVFFNLGVLIEIVRRWRCSGRRTDPLNWISTTGFRS